MHTCSGVPFLALDSACGVERSTDELVVILACRSAFVARAAAFCTRSFKSFMPARICCISVNLQLLQHLPARSYDRPHNTSSPTEAPLPFDEFFTTQVLWIVWYAFFQAHGLSENSLRSAQESMRVSINYAVTENRVHQGSKIMHHQTPVSVMIPVQSLPQWVCL